MCEEKEFETAYDMLLRKSIEISKEQRDEKAVAYTHFNLTGVDVEGALTNKDEKTIINGMFSITKIENSWKYGDQLQFEIFTKKPLYTIPRASVSSWNRLEIYVPTDQALVMMQAVLANKWDGKGKRI